MEFSQEDLFDAIDRIVRDRLDRAAVDDPPVDALSLAQHVFDIPVEFAEMEEDERGRRRPSARKATRGGVVLTDDMTDEQQQQAAANAIARQLLPEILRKIDVLPGTEGKQLAGHVRGLTAGRVLVPTRMLRTALKDCGFDLPELKKVFDTATMETIALRLLDLDDPCVIAVVDDGVVSLRKSNAFPANRTLQPAEQQCMEAVSLTDLPRRVRAGGWTSHGWLVPNRPFRRILLRSVPDDV